MLRAKRGAVVVPLFVCYGFPDNMRSAIKRDANREIVFSHLCGAISH